MVEPGCPPVASPGKAANGAASNGVAGMLTTQVSARARR